MNGTARSSLPWGSTPAFDYYHATPDTALAADMARYDYLLAVQDPPVAPPPGLALAEVKRGRTYVLSRIDRR